MPDSKTKPTTKGPCSKTAKESKVWSLVCLAREVADDAEGIQDYSYLIEENKKLEKQLKDRSNEVLRLNKALGDAKASAEKETSTLTSAFGQQYKIFDQNKEALEECRKQTDEARAELEKFEERRASQEKRLSTAETNARTAKAEAEQLRKKNLSMEKHCIIHRSQLHAAHAERDDLDSKLAQAREELGHGLFHVIDESWETRLRDHLRSLQMESWAIVKDFMSDSEANMAQAQKVQPRLPGIPLLSSTTKEAVLMRHAAGQAIICEALMAHILLPFYVPDDLAQAAAHMLRYFEDDKEQQLTYRHQVNTLLDETDVDTAADAACIEICRHLDRLVPPVSVEGFRRKVEKFLSNAAQIWISEGQRAADLIEVTTPRKGDEGIESYLDFGERSNGKSAKESQEIAATLFPRISVNGRILHSGVVLWSDAPAVILARDQAPSPGLGRNGTLRKNNRRNSVADRLAG